MFCKQFIDNSQYIFDYDFQVETTLHEMMHAAGSLHEQSRLQDREFFISTIWPRTSSAINFFGYQLANAREYDLGSVFQYNIYVSVAKSRDMLVTFTIWWDVFYIHVHPFLIKKRSGILIFGLLTLDTKCCPVWRNLIGYPQGHYIHVYHLIK